MEIRKYERGLSEGQDGPGKTGSEYIYKIVIYRQVHTSVKTLFSLKNARFLLAKGSGSGYRTRR